LKKEADDLIKQLEYDDDKTLTPYNLVDDEYANNKTSDPKILLTTSRHPSQRLLQFLKVKSKFSNLFYFLGNENYISKFCKS